MHKMLPYRLKNPTKIRPISEPPNMAPSVEILKSTANDAYRADSSVLDEVLGIVSQAPGALQYVWF